MVAALVCVELTVAPVAVWPVADQEPEIGSDDPHAVPLVTVPDTVTVIEARARSARTGRAGCCLGCYRRVGLGQYRRWRR